MVEKSQDIEMDKSVAVGNVENNSEKRGPVFGFQELHQLVVFVFPLSYLYEIRTRWRFLLNKKGFEVGFWKSDP